MTVANAKTTLQLIDRAAEVSFRRAGEEAGDGYWSTLARFPFGRA